ncbi:MAG: polyprenyl synthetase family protein, partial [Gemmatimonadota bacterium]
MNGRNARAIALEGLQDAAEALEALDVPVPTLRGKLLRPVVAYAPVPVSRRGGLDRRFWLGALAIQMAHEASLLHDDVIDGAGTRRGRPTVASSRGVTAALIAGDHFLTAAYRAAAMTGSAAFVELFAEAVERTVAGEVAQARSAGSVLDRQGYLAVVTGKSGELFGAAAALHACLLGGDVRAFRSLGLRLGALYQQVDDLLDYLPTARRGKPPLQDYRQEKWTWVLDEAGLDAFDLSDEAVVERLCRTDGRGESPLARCLAHLRTLADALADEHADLSGDHTILRAVLDSWISDAVRAVDGAAADARAVDSDPPGRDPLPASGPRPGSRAPASVRSDPVPVDAGLRGLLEAGLAARARSVGGPEAWRGYFGRHARTFRFASR